LDQGPKARAGVPAYRARMARWLAVLLVCACASAPQWTKAGATTESVRADLEICQAQAPLAPRVQGPSGTPSGIGGERKAAFNTMAEREANRMQKDERVVAECMRGKGYSEN
jgi:hypothetical protein